MCVAGSLTRSVRQLASSLNDVPDLKELSGMLHVKQFERMESQLTDVVKRLIRRQLRSVRERLRELGDKQGNASGLAASVYDPQEWRRELFDEVVPIIAREASRAAQAQLRLLGVRQTRTTGSEWVENMGIDLPPGIVTEMPQWMLDAIEVQLRESFSQPYWDRILERTGTDIERFLEDGLNEGWSVAEMSRRISDRFPDAYSFGRAKAVARTESANALNGARKTSQDALKEELAGQLDMQMVWLSVLAQNTRDAHANLDGVPANAEGLWNLNGVMIPWPGHYSLPAGDRVNCMCTTVTEFGVSDAEAQELISEHAGRLME